MERTDISWIKHDIIFHDKRHPVEMRAFEAERFLFYPANDRHVVFNTIRNQACQPSCLSNDHALPVGCQ